MYYQIGLHISCTIKLGYKYWYIFRSLNICCTYKTLLLIVYVLIYSLKNINYEKGAVVVFKKMSQIKKIKDNLGPPFLIL